MKLHEIDKEMASITQMYNTIKKETPVIDDETKKTLEILDKAKLELSCMWWFKVKEYAKVEL